MREQSVTLTEFLTARLDEDAVAAQAAFPGPWRHDPGKEWFVDSDKLRAARAGVRQSGGEEAVLAGHALVVGVAATGPSDDPQSMADAEHIARHDPARVLADVEAKRRIVALHEPKTSTWPKAHGMEPYVERTCTECGTGRQEPGDPADFWPTDWPCPTLRMLALPFADHPQFRAEWRV